MGIFDFFYDIENAVLSRPDESEMLLNDDDEWLKEIKKFGALHANNQVAAPLGKPLDLSRPACPFPTIY